jgi:hypothetical protein
MWIADIAPPGAESAKVVLRAGIPTRGVWERDVSADAPAPPVLLYVRDNILDQGRFTPSLEGMANPYDPTRRVWHYQCADLKIDARQPGGAVADFFQTDPEGATQPISHVLFDQLRDNSHNLPSGDAAWVHVQVRNRSHASANNVRVWAIYCNAAAGVPSLSASPSLGNAFPFWSQFAVTGQIVPELPADSPWRSVGPPQTLSGIVASTPKVASWLWTVPTLPTGDPGHYCMAVFIHAATSPIGETSFSVDELALRSRQIGQKNLHIGPPLPSSPSGGGGGAPGGQPVSEMREYVEFHNPTAAPREATLVFDLRALPSQLRVELALTALDTVRPIAQSISGVARVRGHTGLHRIARNLLKLLLPIGRLLRLIGCWIENLGRRILGLPWRPCDDGPPQGPRFEPEIYEAEPSALVEVGGVRLPAHGFCAARVHVRNAGTLDEGGEYAFEVRQRVDERVVGGSTYLVRIAGIKRRSPQVEVPSMRTELSVAELQRIEREAEPFKYVPPVAKDIIEQREEDEGRKM